MIRKPCQVIFGKVSCLRRKESILDAVGFNRFDHRECPADIGHPLILYGGGQVIVTQIITGGQIGSFFETAPCVICTGICISLSGSILHGRMDHIVVIGAIRPGDDPVKSISRGLTGHHRCRRAECDTEGKPQNTGHYACFLFDCFIYFNHRKILPYMIPLFYH